MSNLMPVQKTSDGDLVSGYDMNNVSELTVKFDILGLRTLSVLQNVAKETGIKLEEIDLSSSLIYNNLQQLQNPQGLFQIEADTNFRVCQKVKPKSLEELSAVVAIARPGALEFLQNYATYTETGSFQSVNPFFDDVLSYTGGIPLYQEQLMKMAVKVGFTLDEAEQLRRIVGKKKVDQIEAWKQKIEDKIKENGLSEEIASILWKVAEDSANYSFNKCIFEEELVQTKNGSKMLKDLKIGEEIMSFDTNKKENIFVKILDIMHNEKEIYEIEIESGKIIRASLDHKFLTKEAGMKSLREILANDYSIANSI
jgi:DNA polymerase-3 subunit alpha